jgi:hypothetical protein
VRKREKEQEGKEKNVEEIEARFRDPRVNEGRERERDYC